MNLYLSSDQIGAAQEGHGEYHLDMASKKRAPSAAAQGLMKGFGERLRKLRLSRELSQYQLADLSGIHVMQINRYEKGLSVPSAATLVPLAHVFQMTVGQLLGIEKESAESPPIRDVRLFDRFRTLDEMSRGERDVVLQVIDAMIAKRKMAEVLQG